MLAVMMTDDGTVQHKVCINGDEDQILDSSEGFQQPQPRTEHGLATLQIVKFVQVGVVNRVYLSNKSKHTLINKLEKDNKLDHQTANQMHAELA